MWIIVKGEAMVRGRGYKCGGHKGSDSDLMRVG
jgi:hypothetical protein